MYTTPITRLTHSRMAINNRVGTTDANAFTETIPSANGGTPKDGSSSDYSHVVKALSNERRSQTKSRCRTVVTTFTPPGCSSAWPKTCERRKCRWSDNSLIGAIQTSRPRGRYTVADDTCCGFSSLPRCVCDGAANRRGTTRGGKSNAKIRPTNPATLTNTRRAIIGTNATDMTTTDRSFLSPHVTLLATN